METHTEPLAPRAVFLRRLAASFAAAFAIIGISLAAGMTGYHRTEGLNWLDSFLNASMILSGMGPLLQPVTTAGKLFAGIYALYSGLAVLVIAGVMFGPIVHRFLHRFHLEADDE